MDSWARFIQVSESLWFTTNLLKPSYISPTLSTKANLEVTIPVEPFQACSVHTPQQMGHTRKASSDEGDAEEKKRAKARRQEIKGCLDLGFAVEEIGLEEKLVAIIRGVQNVRIGGVEERSRCSSHIGCEMPSLKNGMAMKEHLKSWAFAVACTV